MFLHRCSLKHISSILNPGKCLKFWTIFLSGSNKCSHLQRSCSKNKASVNWADDYFQWLLRFCVKQNNTAIGIWKRLGKRYCKRLRRKANGVGQSAIWETDKDTRGEWKTRELAKSSKKECATDGPRTLLRGSQGRGDLEQKDLEKTPPKCWQGGREVSKWRHCWEPCLGPWSKDPDDI